MIRLFNGKTSARPIGGLPAILITALWLLAPSPAHAFKSVIEGQQPSSTNWINGPLVGWKELDLIPLRTLHTAGPATNQVITISFDHTQNTTIPGIQDLAFFTASSNIIIVAAPTLSAPVGVDIWSYSFTITVTNNQPGTVEFRARMAAGSHLFPGASLNLSLPGPGQMQIAKATPTLGTPDLALSKSWTILVWVWN